MLMMIMIFYHCLMNGSGVIIKNDNKHYSLTNELINSL